MSAEEPCAAGHSFDKEAHAGIRDLLCRYRGDAKSGLQIELSPGDVLVLTPRQIGAIFSALGTHNLLLEECRGYRPRPNSIVALAAGSAYSLSRWIRGVWRDQYADQISSRFWHWLVQNAHSEFHRTLSAEHALCIQATLAGEGLLSRNGAHIGDFPMADLVTSLRGLVGRPLIYEEHREFSAVRLLAVEGGDPGDPSVELLFNNLYLPGFSGDYPPEFSAGGLAAATSMGRGNLSGYMGIYALITGPGTVAHLIEIAARVANRRKLLQACRAVMYPPGGDDY